MQKGINQWSLPTGAGDLLPVLRHAVSSGIPHVELCVRPVGEGVFKTGAADPELDRAFSLVEQGVNAKNYSLNLFDAAEDLKGLKGTVQAAGARVLGVTTLDLFRFTLTSNDNRTREAAAEIIRRMTDICSSLGGKTVLIEPGVVTSSLSYADAYRNCREALKGVVKYAEERNVTLALENVWGKFLLSPTEFRDFIDDFKSEAMGAYFDVANVLEFGHPQDWIRIIGNRIKSVHFKDYKTTIGGINGFCNPFDGNVNWFAVKRALVDIRYSGFLVAEVIIPEIWQEGFIAELSRKMDYFIDEL
jgi:hexulose-6-phosphate isomerase